jgi:hypothetical protein
MTVVNAMMLVFVQSDVELYDEAVLFRRCRRGNNCQSDDADVGVLCDQIIWSDLG